ncbi:MAG: DUF2461 domain-containing protein [Lawsonibacter sp.]|nr:DUF2461 domain-containing protein [Lawsonibacter sp.]
MFQGFSQEAVDFLWALRFNNNREWFQERKAEYTRLVSAPMKELAVQTQQAMLDRNPESRLELRVSRIYRDMRIPHGGGPYKDHLWFVLHRPWEGGMGVLPSYYFEIRPEGWGMGMGYYSAAPLTMAKFRARIDRDPDPMAKLARRFSRQDQFTLEGPLYARPKGDPGALLSPWYNRKSIFLSCSRDCGDELFTPELAGRILEGFDFLTPYFQYFDSLDADAPPPERRRR